MTECPDIDFFTIRTVQVLVDHHFYFWYKINLNALVIPAFCQLALFWIWSNLILPIRMREFAKKALQISELRQTEEPEPNRDEWIA